IRRDVPDASPCLRDLEDYGNELWTLIERTPKGFCHDDMHTGNTVYRGGVFTWMDFDRACFSHPILDVSWLTDGTDFNVFDEGALDPSLRLFEAIHAGYERERHLSNEELAAIFPCLAMIHYDLTASIVLRTGERLLPAFLEEQHQWLMRWRELCRKKGL
ncbi:MAG TPA: phosphotransferase, partial [Clostridia bacterium]|nr:phosphotransferase [Clostridia bacterium]